MIGPAQPCDPQHARARASFPGLGDWEAGAGARGGAGPRGPWQACAYLPAAG